MSKETGPDLPSAWGRTKHKEVETHGIGEGFALFEKPGETLRGICRTFFNTRHGKAVAIQLTEPPTCKVFRSDDDGKREELHPKSDTLVNLSLSGVDLERKFDSSMRDVEVGLQFHHTIETKAGAMKVFRLMVFADELPF